MFFPDQFAGKKNAGHPNPLEPVRPGPDRVAGPIGLSPRPAPAAAPTAPRLGFGPKKLGLTPPAEPSACKHPQRPQVGWWIRPQSPKKKGGVGPKGTDAAVILESFDDDLALTRADEPP